jgi:hypothetical protein
MPDPAVHPPASATADDAPADDTAADDVPAGELDRAIALIQDVIARLHPDRLLPADVLRQLAELRHQLATLCTLLRTRNALAVGARAARDAELDALIARALADLDRAEAEQADVPVHDVAGVAR